uniref:Uncharacterized protein n=1 Tax=Romanomermis culicivorax TaxID=13658 RepID=A0A915L8F2_ROMCU
MYDSVIYLSNISDTNEYKVPIEWSLGDMMDELKDYGQGAYITEFISSSPKNDSYCVYSTKDVKLHFITKVHGITLNHKVAKQ